MMIPYRLSDWLQSLDEMAVIQHLDVVYSAPELLRLGCGDDPAEVINYYTVKTEFGIYRWMRCPTCGRGRLVWDDFDSEAAHCDLCGEKHIFSRIKEQAYAG